MGLVLCRADRRYGRWCRRHDRFAFYRWLPWTSARAAQLCMHSLRNLSRRQAKSLETRDLMSLDDAELVALERLLKKLAIPQ